MIRLYNDNPIVSKKIRLYSDAASNQLPPIPPLEPAVAPQGPSPAGKFAIEKLPGTTQILSDIQSNPLNIKRGGFWDMLKKAGTAAYETGTEAIVGGAEKIAGAVAAFTSEGRPTSEKVGKSLEAVSGLASSFFSPISAIFAAADQLPVAGTVSKLISLPFSAVGEGATFGVEQAIDKLPIGEDSKTRVKQGVGEITALAAQLALGGVAFKATTQGQGAKVPFLAGIKNKQAVSEVVSVAPHLKERVESIPAEKVSELIKTFGKEDAQVIMKVAAEKAVEADASKSGKIRLYGEKSKFVEKSPDLSSSPTPFTQEALKVIKNEKGFDVWLGENRVGQFIGGAKDLRGNPVGIFRLYDSAGKEHLLQNVDANQLQKNLPSILEKHGLIRSIGFYRFFGGKTTKLTSLAQEATKYKSEGKTLEEFVKAQGISQWSELQKTNPDLFNTGILRKSQAPYKAVGEIPVEVHSAQGKWQNYGQDSEIPADVIYKRIDSGSFKGEYVDKAGNPVRDKTNNIIQDVYDDATGEWIKPNISNQQLKDNLLEQFNTPEGKKYLNEVIDALPKNPDGTITAYRIGAIGKGGTQSYTLSEGMAKTFSNQGTVILPAGTPGLPKGGYKDFGVLPPNIVKIDPKGIRAWSPYDAEILVEPKFVKTKSQLKAEWDGVAKITEPPKPVEVRPEVELASRVFERMKAENPQLEGELNYNPIKLKEDAQKAVDLVATDKQKAFRVAMGAETLPDITSTAVNIAMAEKALADGNAALYARLTRNRSLKQTRGGQEMVAERGSVTDNSVSRYVKELIAARLDALGKNYLSDLKRVSAKSKATERIGKEVAKVESQIKGKKLDVKTALSLLEKLTCIT